MKICSACGKSFPETTEYFYRNGCLLSCWCKTCSKQSATKYRKQNHEIIKQKSRERSEKQQQDAEYLKRRSEYDKQYYQQHKEKIKERKRNDYTKADKEKIREYHRQYNEKNKEKLKEYHKQYRKQNEYKLKEYDKQRHEKNKLNDTMSCGICNSLKTLKNDKHWEEFVPYTLQQLKEHLESQFTPEMSWSNYGEYWEVDHIIPKNLFDVSKTEEFLICWSLANLRPLEKSANRRRPKDGSDISDNIKIIIMKGEY